MSKKIHNYFIFDTETGGLKAQVNAVCEIAGIVKDGVTFNEIGRIDRLIKPYGSYIYEPKALEVNGITVAQIQASGVDINQVCEELITLWCAANKGKDRYTKVIFVAQNGGFDIPFLQQMFAFCKKDMSKYVAGYTDFYGNFQPHCIDTLHLAKIQFRKKEDMVNFKLGTICEAAGIDLVDAHRAMNDVIPTGEFFVKSISGIGGGSVKQSEVQRTRTTFQIA